MSRRNSLSNLRSMNSSHAFIRAFDCFLLNALREEFAVAAASFTIPKAF